MSEVQNNTKVELNWDAIDNLINNKMAKLSNLSKELKIKSSELHDILVGHYGDRIVFKRGRNGGIFWSTKE